MSDLDYFYSLTQELNALKNRVRHFINDRHWLSDGLWKESVLRAVLRRHLPRHLEVGSGFIVAGSEVSTQVDILIYDTNYPMLFRDGDFVVVTPDLVRAIIEVKTSAEPSDLVRHFSKLGDVHYMAASTALCSPLVGFFSYQNGGCGHESVLAALADGANGKPRRRVHCVSLGEDDFTRFWHCPPETPRHQNDLWRSYHLESLAPAYFIHNVIESLCQRSVLDNEDLWYPRQGKEAFTLGERRFERVD
jgi:hypothetical protein